MKIDKVYYSPEGVVTCSPEGWPEEPTYGKWCHDDKENMKKSIAHEAAIKKAIASSVPFEDQQNVIKLMYTKYSVGVKTPEDYVYWKRDLGPGFYTIEPVEVKLIDQFLDKTNTVPQWLDLTDSVNIALTHGMRVVARILPKVEIPEFDPHFPCGPKKNIPNTERLIDKVGKAKRVIRDADGKAIGFEPFIKEPPVVEQKQEPQKPDFKKFSEEIWKDEYSELDPSEWSQDIEQYSHAFCQGAEYAWRMASKPAQEREWIPVSERLPELTEQVYWYNDDNEQVPWDGKFERHVIGWNSERGLFMAHYDGYRWAEVAKFGISTLVIPTHWQPLPQPPKI